MIVTMTTITTIMPPPRPTERPIIRGIFFDDEFDAETAAAVGRVVDDEFSAGTTTVDFVVGEDAGLFVARLDDLQNAAAATIIQSSSRGWGGGLNQIIPRK